MRKMKATRRIKLPRRELLKIEGRAVEVSVKLNPRARRLIVKVHPTTGEVTVVAPSQRVLDRALDFARGQTDWIARQLAMCRRRLPWCLARICRFRAGNTSSVRARTGAGRSGSRRMATRASSV